MKKVIPLTDARVRNAKAREKPYRLFDGRGLYLEVRPSGSRYWRLKYRVAGKEKVLGLGVYPEVSLGEARDATTAARKLVFQDRDPVTERRAAKATAAMSASTTFEGVAREWMERKDWAESYRRNVESTLTNNLFPRIGAVPVAEVDAPLLLAALRPIEARGALDLLGRARRWCSEILRYAIATGRRKDDPAAALKGAFKTRGTTNYPALKRAEIGPFLRKLEEYPGKPETRLAVKLLLLTFVRPGELRAAKWEEFDLESREWRIPPQRMKGRTEHLVPLSKQAVAVLKELHSLTGHSAYVFPGGRGRTPYVSENTINHAIATLGYKGRLVGHGFRATASTILNESGHFHHDAIERQLAHKERNSIRAAYHRAEYLPERKRMMQWWGDVLDSTIKGAKVVPLETRS